MKFIIIVALTTFHSFVAQAQLNPNDKVFLIFEEIDGKESVNGDDALQNLKSYLVGKTTLNIVNNKDSSNYYFKLSVVIDNKKRLAKIKVFKTKTNKLIFKSEWMKGTGLNQYYGFSATRMAVGKLVKGDLLDEFPEIKQ